MDVNNAIEIAQSVGGIFRWEAKLKLYAVYFDYGGMYFTVKELASMPDLQYQSILHSVAEQEAYLVENYGGPTKH